MKNIISTLSFAFFLSFLTFGQTVKHIPYIVGVQDGMARLFITKDEHYIISQRYFNYVFDDNGNLISQSKVKTFPDNLYGKLQFGSFHDLETDIFYDIHNGNGYSRSGYGVVQINKLNSSTAELEIEKIEFEDNIHPSRNQASEIWNDFSSYSSDYSKDDNGNIYSFDLYMATSDQTHPNAASKAEDVFNTFVHIVKYNPSTKKIETSNALIDKIEIEKKYKNTAFGDIVGVIDNKLIVRYTSYRSDEMKGLYDATGDAKNYQFDYWTYDLESLKEVKILSYISDFPLNAEGRKMFDKILNDTIYCDLAYTVKATEPGRYTTGHKVLSLSMNGDTSWTNYAIPESMYTINSNFPASFDIQIGPKGVLLMGNSLIVQLESGKNLKCYFLYSKNEDDAVEITVYEQESYLDYIGDIQIFKYPSFGEEEIKSIFERARQVECDLTKGRTGTSFSLTACRIIGDELVLMSTENFNTLSKKQKLKTPDLLKLEKYSLEE